jgi:hypothetical protein
VKRTLHLIGALAAAGLILATVAVAASQTGSTRNDAREIGILGGGIKPPAGDSQPEPDCPGDPGGDA